MRWLSGWKHLPPSLTIEFSLCSSHSGSRELSLACCPPTSSLRHMCVKDFSFYLFILTWVCSLYVCLCTCVPGVFRGQERVLDSLQLELQTLVNCCVSAQNQVSGRAARALNHWAISQPLEGFLQTFFGLLGKVYNEKKFLVPLPTLSCSVIRNN